MSAADGPAKPQADDLKTAKAHEIYLGLKVMSRERVSDDLGFDWGDEIERIAREQSIAEDLGVEFEAPAVAVDEVPADEKADA